MEEKNVCSRCGNFEWFYRRGLCEFYKSNYGWCSKRVGTTERHASCEGFRTKTWKPRASKRLIEKTLTDMSATLERIGQLLAADREEQNEENE